MPAKKEAPTPKIQALPNGRHRVQFRRDGTKFDRTFSNLADAELFITAFSDGHPTFEAFVENIYKTSEAWTSLSEGTRTTYNSRFRRILPVLGSTRLQNLDTPAINRFKNTRAAQTTQRGAKPSVDSMRLELSIIEVVLREAVNQGYIQFNPCTAVRRGKPAVRTRRVHPHERLNLIKVVRNQWPCLPPRKPTERPRPVSDRVKESARFLLILFELGGRAGELANLPVTNISIARREYFLKRTKNGRAQMRPLTNFSSMLIKQQLEYISRTPGIIGGRLFTGKGDKPYSYARAVIRCRTYGMVDPDYHSHANRRELVTSAIEAGMEYRDIQRMTGHDCTESIARYDASASLPPAARERVNRFQDERNEELRAAIQLDRALTEAGGDKGLAGTGDWEMDALDTEYEMPGADAARGGEPPPTMDEMLKALAIVRAERAKKAQEGKA